VKRRTLGFALLTLAVIGVAWKISQDKAPQTEISRSQLYPGLLDRLNDVARVRLSSTDDTTLLARESEGWVLASKDGYPVNGAAVRRTVLQVAGLRVVEPKTATPERYARLGVADIDGADAAGTLVELLAADDAALARLIVGNASDTAGTPRHYVRRAEEAQSWLVEGALAVPADPIPWVDAGIVDIDTARVAEVRIEPAEGAPIVIRKAERDDNFFALESVPTGFEPKSKATVSSGGAVLLDLRFNDVASAAAVADRAPLRTVTVRTFDGLAATMKDYALEDRVVTTFDFAATSPALPSPGDDETDDGSAAADDEGGSPEAAATEAETVAEEAARLAAVTAGWAYVLPDYKRRMIERDLDSLVQPVNKDVDGDAEE
jgi:hypothetical protein